VIFFIPNENSPTYAVSVTEVSVGGDVVGVQLLALFDTGTSFTHLLEPEYGLITKAVSAIDQTNHLF